MTRSWPSRLSSCGSAGNRRRSWPSCARPPPGSTGCSRAGGSWRGSSRASGATTAATWLPASSRRPRGRPDERGFVAAQIDGLEALRERVVEADAIIRGLVEADLHDDGVPGLAKLRRYVRSLQRQLKWYVDQFHVEHPDRWDDPRRRPAAYGPVVEAYRPPNPNHFEGATPEPARPSSPKSTKRSHLAPQPHRKTTKRSHSSPRPRPRPASRSSRPPLFPTTPRKKAATTAARHAPASLHASMPAAPRPPDGARISLWPS